MRISRLYVSENLNLGKSVELDEEAAHYVRAVLRLKKEHEISLFDGLGGEFLCVLSEVTRKKVVADINTKVDRSVESSLYVSLGLGISRGDRMDWGIQKSVELGVNCISPVITERCVVKFKESKKQQKIQHWKSIVRHATEQSGRTILPDFGEIELFQDWLQKQKGLKIFLDPKSDKSLTNLSPNEMNVTILSGPEGGFSNQERELAITAGFIPICLGQRILRTETASLAAISAVQTLWGDFV